MKEWQKLKIANLVRVGKSGLAQFTTIQAAINYAATQSPSATNPWTVEIYPGIYTEQITMSSWVNLKGIGPKGAVVIQQTDATIITTAAYNQIESLTVRLVTPTAGRILFNHSGAEVIVSYIDIVVEITTPGVYQHVVWSFGDNNSNYILTRCSANLTVGNACELISVPSWNPTITLRDCDFSMSHNSSEFFELQGTGTCSAIGCNFSGASSFGRFIAALNATFDNCAILCTGTGLVTVTSATILFRHCTLVQSLVAGNTATIRALSCHYRAVNRTGTGNIVDESPYSLSSIYHVIKKHWEVATAANMNIATRTAVGGTATVGGVGQAVLRINDLALDAAGVESAADAAGSLASTFTPAKTPRYVQQISVNAFRATTTMFFGLRGVLGAAVPGAAEHHAGFIWNGANFIASSSNGGGVGGTTNLTTPTAAQPVQLEVIILGGVQVKFYIDGVLVATHTTAAKIPTAVLYFQEYEISTGAGGATTSDITLREGFIQECPA